MSRAKSQANFARRRELLLYVFVHVHDVGELRPSTGLPHSTTFICAKQHKDAGLMLTMAGTKC